MKIVYFIVGCIALGLGALGVVLPVLPTTPFLLLAVFCFMRSSKRVHDWLVSTNLYKKHLESFVRHRAMTLRTKLSILLPASAMLILAMVIVDIAAVRMFIL